MLFDKKRASVFVKVGAGLLALTFASYFVAVLIPSFQGGYSKQQAPSRTEDSRQEYLRQASSIQGRLVTEPQNKELWIELGNLHFDNKSYADAITAYNKALELDPGNLSVRVDLGTSYSYLSKWEEAKAQFLQVLKVNSNHSVALYNLGVVAAKQQKKDEARRYWKRVIVLSPQSEIGKAAQTALNSL